MNPWYFQCHSMTAQKVPRWFHTSPGIMCPWLVWWMWCWCRNAAEGLWRPEGVNISKGRVRVEGMERSHMAAENIGEQWRMLRMKFYITICHYLWCLHLPNGSRLSLKVPEKSVASYFLVSHGESILQIAYLRYKRLMYRRWWAGGESIDDKREHTNREHKSCIPIVDISIPSIMIQLLTGST